MDFKEKEQGQRIKFFLGRMANGKILPFIPKPPPVRVLKVKNPKPKRKTRVRDRNELWNIPIPCRYDKPIPNASKPLSNGYSFGAWLLKRGFKQLGRGAYSTIYAKDGQDRVIKVTAGPQDNWIDYIQWAAEKGYCGSFAPRVYSWKKFKTDGGEFSVSVVERMESTLADRRDHDNNLVECLMYPAIHKQNLMAQVYLDDLLPGSVKFLSELVGKFNANDMYGKNMMIRKDGSFCVTDPVCGQSELKINRLRSRDFTSLAPANLGIIMVVQELIDILKTYPVNARVLGTGYESGYEDITEVEFTDVVVWPENPSFEGTYQLPWSEARDKGHDQITAVLLN